MLDIPGYKVLGTIRATGSNVLFHAVREADGLPVILKTPMVPTPGPGERERYRREFGILQRLRDVRGVAKPFACERIRERPVLLLEKIHGETLSESMGQPLEVSQCLSVAISLASTLAEIHCRQVIHKDIKPSNIILEPSGSTRLIDFGAATLQKVEHLDAAAPHLIEGTLAYMSPEQTGRMNRVVDYRTDFYSLGVTLYELLTGQRPFQGRDALEWFHAHMAQDPRPPHALNPLVPPALSAIVAKLLAKVAEERYQSAEGLKADLEQCREALRQESPEGFTPGTHDAPRQFQLPQRLYGREAQVATLVQGFERVIATGKPELFLVSGYSGIGKSSVVNELHRPVVQRRGFFLRGKFDQFQRDIPYQTLGQTIRGLLQQLLAGTDEELAAWRTQLTQAWEGQGQVLVDLVPQLEVLVGKQPPVQELPPAEAQYRFHRVVLRSLQVLATAERPLVMFLDDLQWADLASLQLIQQLLSQPEVPPVQWIGAYRDNEVSPAHPLAPVLEEVRKAGARITRLELAPLSLKQVEQLAADALPGAGEALSVPLAAMVHEKTGGNPFFLLQWMVTLNQDGLLVREPGGGWRWDAAGTQAKGYADNVVGFMVDRLRQLPGGTQHLLRLAACVGNVFSLQMLRALTGLEEVGSMEQGLEPALQEGLLARSGPEQYRFLHDRIQQAAHALMSEEERKSAHLRIGRLLLSSLTPEEVTEQLFDVVSQLNAGAELLDGPEERHRAARLNAEAGRKAAAAVAPGPAITYFSAAFALLPGDPWQTDYELAFRVRAAQTKCELQRGNAAGARPLAEVLRAQARNTADATQASCLKSSCCLHVGDLQESLACMLECLEKLGMPLSPAPSPEELVAAHDEVWRLVGERPIESFMDLPPASSPDMKLVLTALSALFEPAYYGNPQLLGVVMSRMAALTLRHGFTEMSLMGLGWFGLLTGFMFKRYTEGTALGRLAHGLVERHGLAACRAQVLMSLQTLSYWTQPYAEVQPMALRGMNHALQVGDFHSASFFFISNLTLRFAQGHHLEDVSLEAASRNEFMARVAPQDAQDMLRIYQRYIQQMRGRSSSFGSLSGDGFDEQAFEAQLTPARTATLKCCYWFIKLQSRFTCGAMEDAREAAAQASRWLGGMVGSIALREYHLFSGLSLAAGFEEAPPERRRELREAIQGHQRQLAEWAGPCAENFRAVERILAGELARIDGKGEEAACAYEEAILAARESASPHWVGLANELAANFWRTRKAPTVSLAFAREARVAYRQWGATGKVQQLDAQWPLIGEAVPADSSTSSSSTESAQIDAITVVKTQQAISSEIVLERLVTTLLQAAVENAGAQRGALLLPDGDTLSVAATSRVSLGGSAVPPEEDPTQALPWTVLSYVRRTQEPVLIGDASKPHPFASDAYLARSKARSVLCLPLMRQERFSGVLYLENNLATNAFSPSRLTLLRHIVSQAAISIENARLYADVERARAELREANDALELRVEERTHELKQAQARLVDTAREVGMAEVASNVLHNVGNVLTSAVINLEMMQHAVGSSRVGRLKQATALILKHREGLAEFLAPGARGGNLPGYLAALAEELIGEQTRLVEDIDAMSRHIEHIRAIVQVQQTYAKTSLMTEECDLAQLIDDALRIQAAALMRHGVALRREVAPVPLLRVDKHKVLQILINLISNAKNALDAVPEGKRHMCVRLRVEDKRVRIQVVDDGMGITPEIQEKLFTHGFTTRRDGHGFGLHSSALAAQMLGGRLTLESEGVGKGAVATLEFPVA
ncbi:trifunctional serine/threonine-protein kinase/ATP-binding protein/sensor histidine kinase [Stigmatella erecta]|uniref:Predicted ATPase n=1 Tax=Stigmatella erecta TaxID=83460 RepID=A0A1I0KJY3_9BACT|nr:ATP-binding sensor histidine kinase [Stigmatella erecta]SEU24464.1 Predicted ATPase [Stigmatella erecta]